MMSFNSDHSETLSEEKKNKKQWKPEQKETHGMHQD